MIQLSDHFDYKRLLRFTMPSIIMLIFTSIYGVVDGFFVSNFVGKTAFTAVNFIMPVLMILGCAGFMFGTGGGALIAITMGAGHKEKADQLFSMLIYVSIACGIVLTGLGLLCVSPVIGYHSGAGNYNELSGLLKKIFVITGVFAILMFLAAQILARPLALLFVGYDKSLLAMTLRGFCIFAFSFLFAGFAIFGSAFFTALGDGLTSALISFLRTLVFQILAVLLLPLILAWTVSGSPSWRQK